MYDNDSANPLAANPVIRKFVAQGKLQVLNAPGKLMQFPAYAHCLQKFGPLTKWLAFIDLDEFICPMEDKDMRPLLAGYEDYAALGLSWKCFSSGGHLSSPKGLVINNYQERFLRHTTRNLHIKSIIQPAKNNGVHTPHSFWPNEGEVAVSASYRPITEGSAMIPICWEKATVHHYVLKSQEDAQRRMIRGRADIESGQPTVDNEDFRRMAADPVELDDSIVRFAGEVERWMEARELPEEHAAALAEHDPEKLVDLAEDLMRQGLLMEAGITLCHAALTRGETTRFWQARTRLAALKGQDELARLFSEKAVRVKSGLPGSPYPKSLPPEKFSNEQAESTVSEVKSLMACGEDERAEALLNGLPEDRRLTTNMWLLLGELAKRRKDLPRAEECFTIALGLEEKPDTYLALLRLRLDQRNYPDARELAFYLINTGTFRVMVPGFYEPLQKVYDDLTRLLDK